MQLVKPVRSRVPAPQQEPPQWEAFVPQLEKSPHSNEDPAQPKINKQKIKKKKILYALGKKINSSLERKSIWFA